MSPARPAKAGSAYPNRDKLYGRKWRKASKAHRAAHPLCAMCLKENRVTIATETDHIIPHKGDPVKFWDQDNWQNLCAYHHRSVKKSEDVRGYSKEIGSDGLPVDPRHPWYQ